MRTVYGSIVAKNRLAPRRNARRGDLIESAGKWRSCSLAKPSLKVPPRWLLPDGSLARRAVDKLRRRRLENYGLISPSKIFTIPAPKMVKNRVSAPKTAFAIFHFYHFFTIPHSVRSSTTRQPK